MVGPSTARAGLLSVLSPTVQANALAVFGTTEANATIDVTTVSATPVCSTTADGLGDFTCFFSSAESDGTELLVTATVLGDTSPAVSVFVDDTPPTAPNPSPSNGSVFAGNAEPFSTVRVRATPSGTELCVTAASAGGTYSCTPANSASPNFEAYAVDLAGNPGPAAAITFDNTPPIAPILASNGTLVAGSAEPFTEVAVTDTLAAVRCSAAAASDGEFLCSLNNAPAPVADLTAVAIDAAGNASQLASISEDITPPAAPAISPNPTSPLNVAGTAEVATTVTASHNSAQLCTVVVGFSGLFDCAWGSPLNDGDVVDLVTADQLGNQTTSSVTVDGVGPPSPTLVSLGAASISLTVETGSTVTVTGWATTCPAPTGASVTCVFTGPPSSGTVLTAIATDAAGNTGTALSHTVDTSAATPTGLRATSSTVTGTAAPSSTVEVRAGAIGAVVQCSTTADSITGDFTCVMTNSQTPATRIYVTAANSFGFTSPAGQTMVAQPGASIGITLNASINPTASTVGAINLTVAAVRSDNAFGGTINPVVVRVDGNIIASRLLTAGASAQNVDLSPLTIGPHEIELSYDGSTQFSPR